MQGWWRNTWNWRRVWLLSEGWTRLQTLPGAMGDVDPPVVVVVVVVAAPNWIGFPGVFSSRTLFFFRKVWDGGESDLGWVCLAWVGVALSLCLLVVQIAWVACLQDLWILSIKTSCSLVCGFGQTTSMPDDRSRFDHETTCALWYWYPFPF